MTISVIESGCASPSFLHPCHGRKPEALRQVLFAAAAPPLEKFGADGGAAGEVASAGPAFLLLVAGLRCERLIGAKKASLPVPGRRVRVLVFRRVGGVHHASCDDS